jgi:perosamine synthetase
MDAKSIASKITKKTKAILAVHWGGAPCDMAEIRNVADAHNLPLIDDAAHAFGAEYNGAMIGSKDGSLSRLTCFSFQAIKGLTTGDGGMICAHNEHDADTLIQLRWFGIDKRKTKANDIGERMAALEVAGYKYNMNNIAAAIGLGNLVGYPARLERRRAIDEYYRAALAGMNCLRLLKSLPNAKSSCWLFTMRVDRRDDFGRAMKDRGIPVSVVDRRIDKHPVFGEGARDLPGANLFDAEQIALPQHDALSDGQLDRIIAAVKAGW